MTTECAQRHQRNPQRPDGCRARRRGPLRSHPSSGAHKSPPAIAGFLYGPLLGTLLVSPISLLSALLAFVIAWYLTALGAQPAWPAPAFRCSGPSGGAEGFSHRALAAARVHRAVRATELCPGRQSHRCARFSAGVLVGRPGWACWRALSCPSIWDLRWLTSRNFYVARYQKPPMHCSRENGLKSEPSLSEKCHSRIAGQDDAMVVRLNPSGVECTRLHHLGQPS